MRLRQRNIRQVDIPNDPDGAWVKIKALSLNDIKRIDSLANDIQMTTNGENGLDTTVKFDPYTRTKLVVKECLVDWFGLYDEFDNEITYSKANIDKISSFEIEIGGEYVDFFTWVDNERVKFEKELKDKKSKAEKN
jgi:hypothetical protein